MPKAADTQHLSHSLVKTLIVFYFPYSKGAFMENRRHALILHKL